MKYKVWICVESCDEEYDEYEDVDLPFAEVATLDTVCGRSCVRFGTSKIRRRLLTQ